MTLAIFIVLVTWQAWELKSLTVLNGDLSLLVVGTQHRILLPIFLDDNAHLPLAVTAVIRWVLSKS